MVPQVGCKAFAKLVFGKTRTILIKSGDYPQVRLVSVMVSEHGDDGGVQTEREFDWAALQKLRKSRHDQMLPSCPTKS